MFGDNKSVIINKSLPSITLKKKHNDIAYHRVREAVTAGVLKMIHIPGEGNISDILAKSLVVAVIKKLLDGVLF